MDRELMEEVDTDVVHRELRVERGESPTACWEMTNGAPGLGLGGMVEAYCGYSETAWRAHRRARRTRGRSGRSLGPGGRPAKRAVGRCRRLGDAVRAPGQCVLPGCGEWPRPDRNLVAAWSRLERHHGDLAIGELITDTGWNRRRLAERFRTQAGLTPKSAARIMRFARASDLLTRPGHRSIASIALSCGYYDQAHFNRDFRALAGSTPTEYLAAQLADVPGTGPGPTV